MQKIERIPGQESELEYLTRVAWEFLKGNEDQIQIQLQKGPEVIWETVDDDTLGFALEDAATNNYDYLIAGTTQLGNERISLPLAKEAA